MIAKTSGDTPAETSTFRTITPRTGDSGWRSTDVLASPVRGCALEVVNILLSPSVM
jgi:hypothetical protein